MVKVEDSWDSDGSLECNYVGGDVDSSGSKPPAPNLVNKVKNVCFNCIQGAVLHARTITKPSSHIFGESFPSSSSGHLRSYFLGMGFSSVLVDKVLEENGDADANLLLESLFRYSEAATATLHGTTNEILNDKTLTLLQMGFTENEVSSAIDNFGPEVPVSELADSIFANQLSYKDEKQEDLSDYTDNMTGQNQNGFGCRDHQTEEYPKSFNDPWISKASSSRASPCGYEDVKGAKRAKLQDPWSSIASSSNSPLHDYEDVKALNKVKQEMQDEWGEAKPIIEPERPTEARFVKEEMPEPRTPNNCRNANSPLSRPPYFFYGNVVDVSRQTWRKLSQFLYGIEPEHVNCQFFSAFVRKEGYLHNLPTERRSHIIPKPPMTIEDALPHTKKWWPSWDTRKQISCISSGTAGVFQLCERLGKTMMKSQGLVSREEQVDILHQCKRLNLIWVGQYKLSPIEPDQVERILGYPRQHTDFWGQQTDRLEVLKHSFQTDTIGYHLSVLRSMYPSGLRVLSVFSGIGGAEIALHRLGIRLKCVVSVEASEINRRILKRWWVTSGQTGVLKQIGGIEKLTIQTLESFMGQFGGFDIIIGGNPGNTVHGCYNGDGSSEMDLNLFFEFVRVYQRVRSTMGRNS